VNLVTGDGSIDCLDQPENQEEFVSKLHMAEFIVSLAILADKGSMLIKMFTFFETSSIAMLFILNCCFEELHIFKPATSKEGNSEVYVIGVGFKKHEISPEIIDKMISNFTSDKNLLQLEAIPADFQKQVVEAARFFMNRQVSVIEGNIRTFRKFDKQENDRIKSMKYHIVEEWSKLYEIAGIKEEQKILHGHQVNNDINLNVRVHSGSHSERMIFYDLSRGDQLQVFFDRLKQFYDSNFESDLNSSCIALRLANHSLKPDDFMNLIYGRRIERVVSSKFILVTLVKFLNELRSFLDDSLDDFSGKKMNVVGNQLKINVDFFRRFPYETYEKEVTRSLLNFLHDTDSEVLVVDGLPLFTQFMVGVVLFLSLFVFTEVHLKRSSGTISFKSLQPNGRENLKILMKTLDNHTGTSAILGITNTKSLFTHSQDFYRSVIDYNNHLCLKFCSFYLNISNNL
jgi:cap2 methyltransferase